MIRKLPCSAKNVKVVVESRACEWIGDLSMYHGQFSLIACVATPSASGTNPIESDPLIMNLLTDPIMEVNGYGMIDLSYFSKFTYKTGTSRLFFDDPTREMGIVMNFDTDANWTAFKGDMQIHLTMLIEEASIEKCTITRPVPLIVYVEFEKAKMDMRKGMKNGDWNEPESLTRLAMRNEKVLKLCGANQNMKWEVMTHEGVTKALRSLESTREYVRKHWITQSRSAEIWTVLMGFDSIERIPERLVKQYGIIKGQWQTLRRSQITRSKLLREKITKLTMHVMCSKQRLVTVVKDLTILKMTFDIIMSVAEVFTFIHEQYEVVTELLRVLYKMFIQKIVKEEDGSTMYVVNDHIKLGHLEMEALIFWSIIHIFERGEIRRVMMDGTDVSADTIEQIADILVILCPGTFKWMKADVDGIAAGVQTPIHTYLGSMLPLCDCVNIFLSAFSTDRPFEYLNAWLMISFLHGFSSFLSGEYRIESGAVMDRSGSLFMTSVHMAMKVRGVRMITDNAFHLYDNYRDILRDVFKKGFQDADVE